MLKPIPLFGLGVSGKSLNVNAQQRLNLYCELQTDPENNTLAIYGTPGLLSVANYGASPARGAYSMGEFRYFVFGNVLWKEANDGTKTNLGSLVTSTGFVSMSDNGTVDDCGRHQGLHFQHDNPRFRTNHRRGFPGWEYRHIPKRLFHCFSS